MNARTASFDDALDAAIDALRGGRPVSAIVGDHASHANQLRPLLEILSRIRPAYAFFTAAEPRLAPGLRRLQAAIRQARIARAPVSGASRGSWGRRLSFASISFPASAVLAVLVAGAGGAAAAAVVTQQSRLPATVTDALSGTWVSDFLRGADPPPPILPDTPSPPSAAAVALDATGTPVTPAARVSVALFGVVGEINGRTFVLQTHEGSWRVQTDAGAHVSGTIATGAQAAVGGVTSGRVLHADWIIILAPDGTPESSNALPQGGPPTDHTPRPPADHTPGTPADHTPDTPPDHTPGASADHTPGTADHTPPGPSDKP